MTAKTKGNTPEVPIDKEKEQLDQNRAYYQEMIGRMSAKIMHDRPIRIWVGDLDPIFS